MIQNKKIGFGMLAITLTFGMVLTGCATISKENNGTFSNINVPAKDFTSLGLVTTENVVENNEGQVFTYYELLKLAKELGADAIVNVVIDVKHEKKEGFGGAQKETWYGSATAIKWVPGLLTNATVNTANETVTTNENVIMSASGGDGLLGGGGASTDGSNDGKKFKLSKLSTWFK